jgi:CheY-like chemotaxis protein
VAKFNGKKVLIVEDYFINQEVIQDILEMLECEVEIAENGQEAVKMYQKNKYDLILMDIQMPILDGYSATKEIRDFEKLEGLYTPIVALTANALVGDKEKCLGAGMDDYISKPIEFSKIEEILDKHIK